MTTIRHAAPEDTLEEALALLDPAQRANVRLGLLRFQVGRMIDESAERERAKSRVDHYVRIAWINAWYASAMRDHINRCIDDRARYGLPPHRLRVRVPALTA